MNITIPLHIYSKKMNDQIMITSTREEDCYYKIEGEYIKLWDLIDGKKTRQMLLAEFAICLDIEAYEIEEEVFAFIDELISMNILEESL